MAEPAANVAEQRVGKAHEPRRDAALPGERAGEDEQRHRHERKRIHAVDHLVRDDRQRIVAIDDERQGGSDPHADADGNADEQQGEKDDEGDGDHDAGSSRRARRTRAISPTASIAIMRLAKGSTEYR